MNKKAAYMGILFDINTLWHIGEAYPLKFLKAISETLKIYDHTKVKKVKDHKIITKHGSVQAEKIIFACYFPLLNFPGMYFARMH